MAQRLRVHVPGLAAGERDLDDEPSKYVARVHRLAPGDTFTAFDPEARLEADAEIVATRAKHVRVRLAAPRPASRVSALDVTLLQGFGKGDKVDQVVRDATALGARRVIVVATERSVARIDDAQRAETRQQRWRSIAAAAAGQCDRGDVPEIAGPLALGDALRIASGTASRRLCLDVHAVRSFRDALGDWSPTTPGAPAPAPALALALAIGPEGGWSADELALIEQHGFERVRFGAFVLRTETAATAVLGALVALG